MAPLFPGCEYEHWLIVMENLGREGATKQQMVDCYVQTLAKVLGRDKQGTIRVTHPIEEDNISFLLLTNQPAAICCSMSGCAASMEMPSKGKKREAVQPYASTPMTKRQCSKRMGTYFGLG